MKDTSVIERHIMSVLVDNEPGVLARVIGLFSGRGYNIESLTVSETDPKLALSRISIVTSGTPMVIEQIKAQLALDGHIMLCLLYTSPSPRDMRRSRMPSSA